MSFQRALTKAFTEGWTDNPNDPPTCYGSITRYESFYCCEGCPLNGHCETECLQEIA